MSFFTATLEIDAHENFTLEREAWGDSKILLKADFEEKSFKEAVKNNFSIGELYSDAQISEYVNESYSLDAVFARQQIIEWVKNNLTYDEITG